MPYTLSDPHPMWGKDKNILNEFGHTEYPKMVYPGTKDEKGKAIGQIVNNKKEEDEVMKDAKKPEKKPEGWTK